MPLPGKRSQGGNKDSRVNSLGVVVDPLIVSKVSEGKNRKKTAEG